MFETINWNTLIGFPAFIGIAFGFLAMYFFRRPTFGIVAAVLGALVGLGLHIA